MFLKKAHLCNTVRVSEREKRERNAFPVVPAGPVNSPTWRKRTESEKEAKGEGKDCRCDRSWRGRRQAIWVREEAEEMSRQGYSSKTEG